MLTNKGPRTSGTGEHHAALADVSVLLRAARGHCTEVLGELVEPCLGGSRSSSRCVVAVGAAAVARPPGHLRQAARDKLLHQSVFDAHITAYLPSEAAAENGLSFWSGLRCCSSSGFRHRDIGPQFVEHLNVQSVRAGAELTRRRGAKKE